MNLRLGVDVAATALQRPEGGYTLAREGRIASSAEMVEMLASWVRDFPVVSIEDGLGEEDWSGWGPLTERLGASLQLVGDDLFTTHPQRLERGIRERVANGVLVKANQNGTLSATIDLIAQAKAAGYATIVSARSGETEDAFMSDLAVGTGAGQIKIGSLRTSSTVAKYNQLLRIEEVCNAPYVGLSVLAVLPRKFAGLFQSTGWLLLSKTSMRPGSAAPGARSRKLMRTGTRWMATAWRKNPASK